MTVDQVKVDGFTAFFHQVEPRLRRGLVATHGLEAGGEATAEAMVYAWSTGIGWRGWRTRPVPVPGGLPFRPRSRPSRWLFPEVEEDRWPWVEPGLPRALHRLSKAQRTVVVSAALFRLVQAEVAELLGVARTSVQKA